MADAMKLPRSLRDCSGRMYEYYILVALVGIGLAISVPQPTISRKLLAFLLVFVAFVLFAAVVTALAYAASAIERLYFLSFGIRRLVLRLKDPQTRVRSRAAMELGYRASDAATALPALVEAAKDPDPGVRADAVESIGRIGPAALPALPALIEAIKEPGSPWIAIVAIGRIGPGGAPAVAPITEALRHPMDLVRCSAAETLGKIGPGAASAVPSLAATLKDPYYITRIAAAAALGEIGDPATAAVPELIEGLKDEETFWQAARTLGRLGWNSPEAVAALKAMLQDGEKKRREEAENALAAIEERRVRSEDKP